VSRLLRWLRHLFGEPPPPRPHPRPHRRHGRGHDHGGHGREADVYGLGEGGTEIADDLLRPGGEEPPHHHP
jgi:hypothetical protein